MLDGIQGISNEGNRTDKTEKSSSGEQLGQQFRAANQADAPTRHSISYSVDIKRRLVSVAGELEKLLSNLSVLQSRANVGTDILANISKMNGLPPDGKDIRNIFYRLNDDIKKAGLPIRNVNNLEPQTLMDVGQEVQIMLEETSTGIKNIEHSIAEAQVSFQNIVTAGGTIDEGAVDSTVRGNFIHNGLNGENVILLLEK